MSHQEDIKRYSSARCYYFKLPFFLEAQQLPRSQLAHHIQPQNTTNWVFLLLTSFLKQTLAFFFSFFYLFFLFLFFFCQEKLGKQKPTT